MSTSYDYDVLYESCVVLSGAAERSVLLLGVERGDARGRRGHRPAGHSRQPEARSGTDTCVSEAFSGVSFAIA